MQSIFVMIKCIVGKAYMVGEELAENPDEISEMNSISGKYDLFAKFCVSTAASRENASIPSMGSWIPSL